MTYSVILHIYVKARDTEFQLISKILIHFKIWVLIGQDFPEPSDKCENFTSNQYVICSHNSLFFISNGFILSKQ